jgi:hypothetical protein
MLIYRRVYGFVRDRIYEAGAYADPWLVPIDRKAALGHVMPELVNSPEVLEIVERAEADARADRRPAW